jgi:hypothetical protein
MRALKLKYPIPAKTNPSSILKPALIEEGAYIFGKIEIT